MSIHLFQISLTQLQGVGPQKAEELHALGISTVGDLIEYYPFRYEDYRVREMHEIKDGERITIQGTIASLPTMQRFGGKTRLICRVTVESMLVTAVWFNRAFLKEQLTPGREITLTGKWEQRRRQMTVADSEFPDKGGAKTGTLQPVYSVGGSLTQASIRKMINQALIQFGALIPEILPAELLEKHALLPRRSAITRIHRPENTLEGQEARRRMVYEELFLFQLKLQAYRATHMKQADGLVHPVNNEEIRQFVSRLPFELTGSQKQVINEILHDMKQPYVMNRLLQGDVGSGKTVVAAVGLYATVKAGHQGALMVPTEILAEQHTRSLGAMFEPYGIQVGLLTGSLTERKRRDLIASLQMGLLDIVVGTHALIQEDVYFRSLGLVITDEQHRFGVNQRSILRRKGMNPDVLTMTATPIPRTLAITVFGDMDVSTLRERPKGRKPIKTYSVKHNMMDRVLGFIRKEAEQGRQTFFICPLIEESEKLDVQNAIDLHMQLTHALPELAIGLLHGRMNAAEKEATMATYAAGETNVLVSTTVIEVGVDVPNATLMIVMDADRFGLSQLHQLRGRVGRGEHQSFCILIADPKSENGQERMKAMTDTDDGFEISRRDLEIRGPGEFFGTKQSGMPEFRLANLVNDFEVLEQARDDAAALTASESFWSSQSYKELRDNLNRDAKQQTEPLD
ncbi:ATP-dependent DNA helicase RecG [Cohnella abietis]|uniref:ATP-dependent DNA helicase RecG n=1 Tax=Cohnella abietis TaxID=2507935 RepID=A0A3T1D8U5_9BACL|nr:ATP-dependent DNA helicase RecG [Cohnella abietis]BBI34517.1 ATP-dependent DNA helicase RecG [Cohnella abietis]